jgi:cell division septal protein FtsQ
LELRITERTSWALISVPESMIVVDQEGFYLDTVSYISNPHMPLITLSEMPNLIMGQPTNQSAVESVYKLYSALDEDIVASISEYHYNVSTGEITLYTIQGTEIRFGSTEERIIPKISLIRQALALEKEFSLEGRETLTYMDIRYEGSPVIHTN